MLTPVLTKLIEPDGVQAACGGERGAIQFAFQPSTSNEERERLQTMLELMVDLVQITPTGQDEVRMTLTTQSLVVRRNRDMFVGLVAVKGHPVIKSVQRMVRKSFKKLGNPLPDKRPRPASPPLGSGVPQASTTAPTRPIEVTPPSPPSNEGGDSGPPPAF